MGPGLSVTHHTAAVVAWAKVIGTGFGVWIDTRSGCFIGKGRTSDFRLRKDVITG
jgi:hypothetical protein